MNTPLMDAATEADEPSQLIEELTRLFENEAVRTEELRQIVHRAKQVVREHPSAALNLAIAVGTEICSPAYLCNEEYVRSFRRDARTCEDFSLVLELRYAELLLRALRERTRRSSAAIDHKLRTRYEIAAFRAQRYVDDLRPQVASLATPACLAAS